MFDIEVRVTPREGIVDPEGHTIGQALESLGYRGVGAVQAGRLIRFALEAEDEEGARDIVGRMCEELIANPVIERYEVRIHPAET